MIIWPHESKGLYIIKHSASFKTLEISHTSLAHVAHDHSFLSKSPGHLLIYFREVVYCNFLHCIYTHTDSSGVPIVSVHVGLTQARLNNSKQKMYGAIYN